jgi:hypothetical protein
MREPAKTEFVRLLDEIVACVVAGLDWSAFMSLPDETATCALAALAVTDTSNAAISL